MAYPKVRHLFLEEDHVYLEGIIKFQTAGIKFLFKGVLSVLGLTGCIFRQLRRKDIYLWMLILSGPHRIFFGSSVN